MASFETTGVLKVKRDTQQVSEKFSKREFVLTTDQITQYPQYITLQLTQDKCALLDSFREGDEMKVSFNVRGREWSGPDGVRYFNTLEAWRLEKINTAPAQSYAAPSAVHTDVMPNNESSSDDLPF
jgi:hypothetical protein